MKRNPVAIILNDIRSTLNVGAIFRTADAVNAEQIYITGITATPEHSKVAKTSLGAEETVPWEQREDIYKLIDELKLNGYQIVGLELTKDAVDFWKAKFEYPVALLLGNEVEGITEKLLRKCDLVIKIPMLGAKESLNVSTATGIALYEISKEYIEKAKS